MCPLDFLQFFGFALELPPQAVDLLLGAGHALFISVEYLLLLSVLLLNLDQLGGPDLVVLLEYLDGRGLDQDLLDQPRSALG